MNFYLDTEFIEKPGSIQLISIGIIDETGENKYYAISSEFNPEDASTWVKSNVIAKLEPESEVPRKTNKEILNDIIKYIEYSASVKYFENKGNKWFAREIRKPDETNNKGVYEPVQEGDIVFYGDYSDYDWVLFCWLFGTMMDLPKGMPMYCKDLKQEMDALQLPKKLIPSKANLRSHHALDDAIHNRLLHKALSAYEAQKISEGTIKEYENLRDEITDAVKSFEILYKKSNPKENVEFRLKLNKLRLKDNKEFIAKAALTLEVKRHGLYNLIASKTFGFRNEEQYAAEYDWGLKLYREMLAEINGTALTFILLKLEANEQLGNTGTPSDNS